MMRQKPLSGTRTTGQRREVLDAILHQRLAGRRWRLVFYSETSAVIARGRKINHLLHGLLTAATGFWLFVWLTIIAVGGERRELIFIHPSGAPEISRID
jgi:hypothetical protein